MDRSHLLRSVLLLLALVPTLQVSATTVESHTGEELVEAASTITIGSCTEVSSEWWQGALATRYSITISETLKGDTENVIELYVPGGVDRDREVPIAVTVPGAPILLPGKEVLLFLDPLENGPAGYSIVGFSQGLFHIHRDSNGIGYLSQGSNQKGGMALDRVRQDILQHLANIQTTAVDGAGGKGATP